MRDVKGLLQVKGPDVRRALTALYRRFGKLEREAWEYLVLSSTNCVEQTDWDFVNGYAMYNHDLGLAYLRATVERANSAFTWGNAENDVPNTHVLTLPDELQGEWALWEPLASGWLGAVHGGSYRPSDGALYLTAAGGRDTKEIAVGDQVTFGGMVFLGNSKV